MGHFLYNFSVLSPTSELRRDLQTHLGLRFPLGFSGLIKGKGSWCPGRNAENQKIRVSRVFSRRPSLCASIWPVFSYLSFWNPPYKTDHGVLVTHFKKKKQSPGRLTARSPGSQRQQKSCSKHQVHIIWLQTALFSEAGDKKFKVILRLLTEFEARGQPGIHEASSKEKKRKGKKERRK